MKSLNIWLAHRMLLSKKKVGFISWSGLISILGVAVGSFALVISVAILNGFEREVRQKIIGFESDIRISGNMDKKLSKQVETKLEEIKGIESYSFFLERKGIILSEHDRCLVLLKAVEAKTKAKVQAKAKVERSEIPKVGTKAKESSPVRPLMEPVGSLAGPVRPLTDKIPIVHIGRRVADRLGLSEGDRIKLLSPLDSQIYSGIPTFMNATVGSIFTTNILDFDDRYCFIPLEAGQLLFNQSGTTHGVDVRLAEGAKKEWVVQELNLTIPGKLSVFTWEDLHQTLFGAMKLEKLGTIFVLSLIVVVASFNITSTLVMLVIEKVREIGILRTLGASRNRIRRIFTFQGMLIGGIGLVGGLFFGLLFIFIQHRWGLILLPGNIYFVKSLPVSITSGDVVIIGVIAVILILISIRYPARIAGKLVPREAVHFEK
ncbi:MAG: FtsX-like permease family protein [Candidatus Marinimicrobia bacterium]|nr:FtsX-like permease family protein [Candidatus Neomarinimicrobiota bacterium]